MKCHLILILLFYSHIATVVKNGRTWQHSSVKWIAVRLSREKQLCAASIQGME